MRKRTKWLTVLCAGILVFSIGACGRDDGEGSSSGDTGSVTQEEETPEDTGSGEESTPEESGSVSQGGDDGSPEEGQVSGWSEEMQGIRSAVVEAVGEENYWPDMLMEADMLEMSYGITPDMYEDYMAESPMISNNVDALVVIRAKEDQVDAVEEALNTYREANINNTMQYPANLGKIQAAQVETIGNYVVFVQLGGFAIDADDEKEVLEKCQEANKLALDAIRGIVE